MGLASAASSHRTVRLADGRRLSYTEWGQSNGRPVLEFRGLPSSRLGDVVDLAMLARAGVRRITVDRPGVGFSDPQPGRALLDWPDDIRVLTDALALYWAHRVEGRTRRRAATRCLTGSPERQSLAGWARWIDPAPSTG